MKTHNNIEQGSDEWHQIRKGKITGTVLKSIMGTAEKRENALYEIIAERLTVGVPDPDDHENPMQRGNRLEPEAVAAFEFETGLQTWVTGFCESDSDSNIANSPDRLIVGEESALEVKCPEGKNYVKGWMTNAVPPEYDWQVTQYFVVNEPLEKVYFAMYNPDIQIHPLHIIVVTRQMYAAKIQQAIVAEERFLKEANDLMARVIEF